jgi:hypothetical protein
MLFQFAEKPEVRTKVGTNPAKFAYVRLCLQTGETRMKKTITGNPCSTSALSLSRAIPQLTWRRVAALHRELSRLCAGKTYFLSCRDTRRLFLA